MRQWGQMKYEQPDYYRIGHTRIGQVTVSTVWLGLDHRFGEGPPIIFETMVFGGPDDQRQERYCTEAEALLGHEHWVARERSWRRRLENFATSTQDRAQQTVGEVLLCGGIIGGFLVGSWWWIAPS